MPEESGNAAGFRPCADGDVLPPSIFVGPLLGRADGGEEVRSIRGSDAGRGVETTGGVKGLIRPLKGSQTVAQTTG